MNKCRKRWRENFWINCSVQYDTKRNRKCSQGKLFCFQAAKADETNCWLLTISVAQTGTGFYNLLITSIRGKKWNYCRGNHFQAAERLIRLWIFKKKLAAEQFEQRVTVWNTRRFYYIIGKVWRRFSVPIYLPLPARSTVSTKNKWKRVKEQWISNYTLCIIARIDNNFFIYIYTFPNRTNALEMILWHFEWLLRTPKTETDTQSNTLEPSSSMRKRARCRQNIDIDWDWTCIGLE